MAQQVALTRAQEHYDERFTGTSSPTSPSSDRTPYALGSMSSAFTIRRGNLNLSVIDIAKLQEGLKIIETEFINKSPIRASYIALLKDNGFDPDAVIRKLKVGEEDARQLGLRLRYATTVATTPPANYCPTFGFSGSPTPSSRLPANFYPGLWMKESQSLINHPTYHIAAAAYPQNSSAAHFQRLGSHFIPSFTPSYYLTAPYAPFFTPNADVRARFSPPIRPVDGHTSGDSCGSPVYNKEAAAGNGRDEPTSASSTRSNINSRIPAVHRRVSPHHPHGYEISFQDWRETAANA